MPKKEGKNTISTDIITHPAEIDKKSHPWKIQLCQLEFGIGFLLGALVAEVLLAAIFLTVFYCPLVGSAPSAPSIPLGAEGAEIPHLSEIFPINFSCQILGPYHTRLQEFCTRKHDSKVGIFDSSSRHVGGKESRWALCVSTHRGWNFQMNLGLESRAE